MDVGTTVATRADHRLGNHSIQGFVHPGENAAGDLCPYRGVSTRYVYRGAIELCINTHDSRVRRLAVCDLPIAHARSMEKRRAACNTIQGYTYT
jgi:hypothetical protein